MSERLQAAMAELESLGTAQNRKTYQRHGVGENLFGVSFADLERLRKKHGKDTALAEELWATGNFDARNLAIKIADPKTAPADLLDRWQREAESNGTVDVLVKDLVSVSPHAVGLMREWLQPGDVRAGWMLLAALCTSEDGLEDAELLGYLSTIERDVHRAPNRVKDAMNAALIAIGLRSESLQGPALAAADRIGKVHVDHGDTACKTPEARAYIEKALAGGKTRWQRKTKAGARR